jgi:hypothetical protein
VLWLLSSLLGRQAQACVCVWGERGGGSGRRVIMRSRACDARRHATTPRHASNRGKPYLSTVCAARRTRLGWPLSRRSGTVRWGVACVRWLGWCWWRQGVFEQRRQGRVPAPHTGSAYTRLSVRRAGGRRAPLQPCPHLLVVVLVLAVALVVLLTLQCVCARAWGGGEG